MLLNRTSKIGNVQPEIFLFVWKNSKLYFAVSAFYFLSFAAIHKFYFYNENIIFSHKMSIFKNFNFFHFDLLTRSYTSSECLCGQFLLFFSLLPKIHSLSRSSNKITSIRKCDKNIFRQSIFFKRLDSIWVRERMNHLERIKS